MSLITVVVILRMIAYGAVAMYAIRHRRWIVWATFTALVFSTYVYRFTKFDDLTIESIRTLVGVGLVYITVRRR